jgi:predicted dienelactone hydrolase
VEPDFGREHLESRAWKDALKTPGFLLGFVAAMTVAQAADVQVVGFQGAHMSYGSEAPLVAGIWYPSTVPHTNVSQGRWPGVVADAPITGAHLPLVVLSHGGGGSYEGHYDTAIALARAGFVAAAVSHAGDTYDDESKVLQLWRRPAQLRRLITYMLEEWPEHRLLDDERVGAFGFSNGGFTVLVAAGGVPDLMRISAYCQAHASHNLCTSMQKAGLDPRSPGIRVPAGAWVADPRIKAIVVAAPAFAFAFDQRGLRNVHVPIQLWRAADDRRQPDPYYEEAVRKALPMAPEYRVVSGAGHFAFLPPCGAALAAARPEICSDAPGFDRAAFHAEFDAQITRFFQAHLAR